MEETITAALSGFSFSVTWGALGEFGVTPRATVSRVSGVRPYHLTGPGLTQGRLQVDCYGASPEEAVAASKEIRGVLEGFESDPVQGVFLDSIRDSLSDDAGLLHRVILTFSVTYRE